jgi:hypothetical protein
MLRRQPTALMNAWPAHFAHRLVLAGALIVVAAVTLTAAIFSWVEAVSNWIE